MTAARRLGPGPSHDDSLTIDILLRDVRNEPPVPSDRSLNCRGSALAASFFRGQLEGPQLQVIRAGGARRILHAIPGDHA